MPMETFDIDTGEYSSAITDFLASFYDLCYACGGLELAERIQNELKFRITAGQEMIEAIQYTYDNFRREYDIQGF